MSQLFESVNKLAAQLIWADAWDAAIREFGDKANENVRGGDTEFQSQQAFDKWWSTLKETKR